MPDRIDASAKPRATHSTTSDSVAATHQALGWWRSRGRCSRRCHPCRIQRREFTRPCVDVAHCLIRVDITAPSRLFDPEQGLCRERIKRPVYSRACRREDLLPSGSRYRDAASRIATVRDSGGESECCRARRRERRVSAVKRRVAAYFMRTGGFSPWPAVTVAVAMPAATSIVVIGLRLNPVTRQASRTLTSDPEA